MPKVEIEETTDYDFEDISSEEWRQYNFGGVDVTIDDPQWLAVSENGHRVLDGDGISHYVGFDGVYFSWESAGGEPHFVK